MTLNPGRQETGRPIGGQAGALEPARPGTGVAERPGAGVPGQRRAWLPGAW